MKVFLIAWALFSGGGIGGNVIVKEMPSMEVCRQVATELRDMDESNWEHSNKTVLDYLSFLPNYVATKCIEIKVKNLRRNPFFG